MNVPTKQELLEALASVDAHLDTANIDDFGAIETLRRCIESLPEQGEAVAEVKQNSAGQVYVQWKDSGQGTAMAMLNHVGKKLYASLPPTSDEKRDAERLDYLDAMNKQKNDQNGSRYGWRLVENHNRIALEDHNWPQRSVRKAIDLHKAAAEEAAIASEKD